MNIDEPTPPFQADEAITALPEESMLDETLALNNAAAQVEALCECVDDAFQVSDTFIELDHALAQTVVEGGALPEVAGALTLAVEQMSALVGYDASKRIIPTLEKFKDPQRRVQATKVAMEGLKEAVVEIMQAIVKTCTRILQALARYIDNALRGWGSIQQRAEYLLAIAKRQAKASVRDDALIEPAAAGSFARVLAHEGEFKGGDGFAAQFTDFVRDITKLKLDQSVMLSGCIGHLSLALKGLENDEGDSEVTAKCMRVIAQSVSGHRSSKQGPEGCEVFELPLGFGDRSFWSYVPEPSNPDPKAIKAMTFEVDVSSHFVSAKELRQGVPGLDEKLVSFLQFVLKSAKDGEARDVEMRDMAAGVFESLAAALNRKIAALSRNGTPGESTQTVNAISLLCGSLSKILSQGNASLTSYQMTVYRAALNFAASSPRMDAPIVH